MSYVLYGDRGSGSAIVELALAEIGADVEIRSVRLEKNAQRAGVYAAINPQQKLPALQTPRGETLTESAAILLVLADRHPDAALIPVDTVQRALALRWLLFMATELYPVIEIVDYPQRFQPEGDQTDEARKERLTEHARSIWKRRWLIVEQATSGRKWFLADGFSVLDIYAAVLSRWGQIDSWRSANLPRIDAIAAALCKRERLDVVWQRHFG